MSFLGVKPGGAESPTPAWWDPCFYVDELVEARSGGLEAWVLCGPVGPSGDIQEMKSVQVLSLLQILWAGDNPWPQGCKPLAYGPCNTSGAVFFFLAVGHGAEEWGYHIRAVCTALPQPDVQCPENGKSSVLQGRKEKTETIFVTGHPLLIAFLTLPPSASGSHFLPLGQGVNQLLLSPECNPKLMLLLLQMDVPFLDR